MRSFQYDAAFDDGFFFCLQRLNELFCSKNSFHGFTKKQIEAFISGAFNSLLGSEKDREIVKTNTVVEIVCDIDKNDKKQPMKNFRMRARP